MSEYEVGKRQPAVPTLARLIAATGHELTLGLERSGPAARSLPDTSLGRRLRQHRKALLEAVHSAGASNLRVLGSVGRGQDGPDSDVDLLVDLAPVTSRKPRVRAAALAEAVAL